MKNQPNQQQIPNFVIETLSEYYGIDNISSLNLSQEELNILIIWIDADNHYQDILNLIRSKTEIPGVTES